MAGAIQPASARAGVTFEVERAEVKGDELVVRGRWSGVRGMRFMRPTLVVGGRPLLATLEHKPWAPDADPWVAAFPWPGGKVDRKKMSLAVAPSVTVPLHPDAEPVPVAEEERPDRAPAPTPAAENPDRLQVDRLETEIGFLRDQLREVTAERDALRAEAETAKARKDAATAEARSVAATRDEISDARATAERDRDRIAAQLEEAVRDLEAAVRTRARMEAQRDEAVGALESLRAERDQARAERAEAIAQRDDVLLAHEALQRRAATALADDDRERFTHDEQPPRDLGPDAPIGVRTIPAARTVAPELDRTRRPPSRDVSSADLWAIRIFGSIAAVCFITLLALILRVFL